MHCESGLPSCSLSYLKAASKEELDAQTQGKVLGMVDFELRSSDSEGSWQE